MSRSASVRGDRELIELRRHPSVVATTSKGNVEFALLPPFSDTLGEQLHELFEAATTLLATAFGRKIVDEYCYRGRKPQCGSLSKVHTPSHDMYLVALLRLGMEPVSAAALRLNLPRNPANRSRRHVQIVFLATAKRHRGLGLGRLLASLILRQAANADHEYATASLIKDNTEGFWMKAGFQPSHGACATAAEDAVVRASRDQTPRYPIWLAKLSTVSQQKAELSTPSTSAAAGGAVTTRGLLAVGPPEFEAAAVEAVKMRLDDPLGYDGPLGARVKTTRSQAASGPGDLQSLQGPPVNQGGPSGTQWSPEDDDLDTEAPLQHHILPSIALGRRCVGPAALEAALKAAGVLPRRVAKVHKLLGVKPPSKQQSFKQSRQQSSKQSRQQSSKQSQAQSKGLLQSQASQQTLAGQWRQGEQPPVMQGAVVQGHSPLPPVPRPQSAPGMIGQSPVQSTAAPAVPLSTFAAASGAMATAAAAAAVPHNSPRGKQLWELCLDVGAAFIRDEPAQRSLEADIMDGISGPPQLTDTAAGVQVATAARAASQAPRNGTDATRELQMPPAETTAVGVLRPHPSRLPPWAHQSRGWLKAEPSQRFGVPKEAQEEMLVEELAVQEQQEVPGSRQPEAAHLRGQDQAQEREQEEDDTERDGTSQEARQSPSAMTVPPHGQGQQLLQRHQDEVEGEDGQQLLHRRPPTVAGYPSPQPPGSHAPQHHSGPVVNGRGASAAVVDPDRGLETGRGNGGGSGNCGSDGDQVHGQQRGSKRRRTEHQQCAPSRDAPGVHLDSGVLALATGGDGGTCDGGRGSGEQGAWRRGLAAPRGHRDADDGGREDVAFRRTSSRWCAVGPADLGVANTAALGEAGTSGGAAGAAKGRRPRSAPASPPDGERSLKAFLEEAARVLLDLIDEPSGGAVEPVADEPYTVGNVGWGPGAATGVLQQQVSPRRRQPHPPPLQQPQSPSPPQQGPHQRGKQSPKKLKQKARQPMQPWQPQMLCAPLPQRPPCWPVGRPVGLAAPPARPFLGRPPGLPLPPLPGWVGGGGMPQQLQAMLSGAVPQMGGGPLPQIMGQTLLPGGQMTAGPQPQPFGLLPGYQSAMFSNFPMPSFFPR